MDSFKNFLKSISEALSGTPDSSTSSGAEVPTSSSEHKPSSNDLRNDRRNARIKAIRNQTRDDDEFEEIGAKHIGPKVSVSSLGITSGIALAALAIGGYAIGKAYFSKEVKISETNDEIIQKLKEIEEDSKEFPVVGLDCQWTQTFDRTRGDRIGLLQIASHKGTVLLIQMLKLYSFPDELKNFLRNRTIIKSGIEGLKDARYLFEDYGIVVVSTFDLRFIAEETGHRPEGLAKLAYKILDFELDRSWDLVASNWTKDILDENQILYAEKAVKASVDIFKKLVPFVITDVNRREILNYCSEHVDKTYIFYSQNY